MLARTSLNTPRAFPKIVAATVLFLLVTASLLAQTGPAYQRVLVPVVLPPDGIQGAFGALWVTRFWLRNNADEPVSIRPHFDGCQLGLCPPPGPVEPARTFSPPFAGSGPARGLIMFIEEAFADKVKLSVRTFDTSRSTKSWGTELPIVRESEFSQDELLLFDVPRDPRFRSALRIYSLSGESGQMARVRIYRLDSSKILPSPSPDELIAEHSVVLTPPSEVPGDVYPSSTFLYIDPLVGQTDAQHITVSVEPVTSQPMWAFVSVTNNETQEITTISPQP